MILETPEIVVQNYVCHVSKGAIVFIKLWKFFDPKKVKSTCCSLLVLNVYSASELPKDLLKHRLIALDFLIR